MRRNDPRDAFILIIALIGLITVTSLILQMDFSGSPDSINKNTKITAKAIESQAIPTPISWMATATEKIQNPLILLLVIVGIMWLFKMKPRT